MSAARSLQAAEKKLFPFKEKKIFETLLSSIFVTTKPTFQKLLNATLFPFFLNNRFVLL